MSMVARTNPGPAEDDITDTDDGDTRISAGAFWPDIVLRELRLAVRLPGRVTTSRLLHTATGAVYEKIAAAFRQASRELNIPVEWGGDWKTLKDGPHFQLPHGAYPA